MEPGQQEKPEAKACSTTVEASQFRPTRMALDLRVGVPALMANVYRLEAGEMQGGGGAELSGTKVEEVCGQYFSTLRAGIQITATLRPRAEGGHTAASVGSRS